MDLVCPPGRAGFRLVLSCGRRLVNSVNDGCCMMHPLEEQLETDSWAIPVHLLYFDAIDVQKAEDEAGIVGSAVVFFCVVVIGVVIVPKHVLNRGLECEVVGLRVGEASTVYLQPHKGELRK